MNDRLQRFPKTTNRDLFIKVSQSSENISLAYNLTFHAKRTKMKKSAAERKHNGSCVDERPFCL